MRWDFNGAWEGVVTRGPRKGTRMMCKVSSLTTDKWAIVSKTHGYTVAFENASYEDKTATALHSLQDHLHATETSEELRSSSARSCGGDCLLAAPVGEGELWSR